MTQRWDSRGTGRVTWDSQGTARVTQHTKMSRLDVPNQYTPLLAWSCSKATSPLSSYSPKKQEGVYGVRQHYSPAPLPCESPSDITLPPCGSNSSVGIHHFPNLELFLTSWKQQNKQHLICKLPALDSVPRGGGKPRR